MKRILTGLAVLLLLTGTAQAQSSPAKTHPQSVYHQMNLTAEQRAKLKILREEFKHKAYTLRNEPLPEDDRRLKMQALHKEHRAAMETILTPAQKQQLAQAKATNRENRPERKNWNSTPSKRPTPAKRLHEELNLTTAQQLQWNAIRKDFKTKAVTLHNNATLNEGYKKSQVQALKKERQQALKTVLTKEQAEKLQALRQERAAGRTR